MRLKFTPAAMRDLDAIWTFSADRWSIAQAETHILALGAACQNLCSNPEMGTAIDAVRAGYRKQRSGSHFIYYRLSQDELIVVRILHQSMDVDIHI